MNNAALYILAIVLLAGFGLMFYYISQLKNSAKKPEDDQAIKVMMEWMKQLKGNSERHGHQQQVD
jgi:hypothetical protein